MSGRGLPGGGLVRRHKPEDIQVTLNLRTTVSSATISLPDASSDSPASPEDSYYIRIHASIKHSTRPALPVSLSTWRTPLERSTPASKPQSSSSSPVWLNSALTYLRSTSNPDRYGGPPSLGYKVQRRGGFARDLRQDWDFITVPSLESGDEVVVEHRLPVEKFQFWKKREDGYRDEVRPEKGEKWLLGPSEGGLGTFWWRWGDLEGDLQGMELRNEKWWDGGKGHEDGDGDGNGEGDKGEEGKKWVESEGENGFGLTMEIENQAEVEFI